MLAPFNFHQTSDAFSRVCASTHALGGGARDTSHAITTDLFNAGGSHVFKVQASASKNSLKDEFNADPFSYICYDIQRLNSPACAAFRAGW